MGGDHGFTGPPAGLRRRTGGAKRAGLSLLEMMVAGALLATLLTISLKLIGASASQWRAMEQRTLAIQEASTLLERLTARKWSDVTPEAARKVELSAAVSQALPGAELAIDVAQPADDKQAKRIRVEIRWQDVAGRRTRPVGLVAWRYRDVEPTTVP